MNRFGDGLVTLLMFALGLGCLSLAFRGLMDGAVGGAGGASFAFETKPVKFMLIEVFWVGLGLIFLFGAWRGASRSDVDVDDEGDQGYEQDDVTRPMRLPVQPPSGPAVEAQAAGLSTVARTSAPTMARTAQLVPFTNAGNLTANPAALVSKAAEPRPLSLYTSRFYAVLVFMVFTLFVMGSVYTAVALAHVFGKVLVVILTIPVVLAYVRTMAQCWRNFFWEGPLLVMDRSGITNYRKGGHLIPWTEVDAVRLDAQNSATYLVLRFRRVSDVHAHFGKLRWLQAITGHLFYKGFEGRVKLTSLVFTRSTVLQTAQAFLRYSRR